MNRVVARTFQVIIDLGVLAVSFWLAVLVRFDWVPPLQMLKRALFLLPYVVGFEYLLLFSLGVTRFSWRYIGLREISRVFWAMLAASAVLTVARFVAAAHLSHFGYAQYALVPLGVIAADFLLGFLAVTGVRVARRVLGEHVESRRRRVEAPLAVPTVLIGAGQAGVMVAKELSVRPDLGIKPVGFLDDDRMKIGTVVHGIPVTGPTEDIAAIAQTQGAQQVIITIASAPGREIRRIAMLCRNAGFEPKIIPGLYEIVGGQVNLSRIRPVAIEDLLGRDPVQLDESAVGELVRGRIVMVTGAGGSIGAELCRQISRFEPKRLLLVEQAENALFQIHRELTRGDPHCGSIVPCIADITDRERIASIFSEHRPDVVLHAAAHKHVPMMEWNPGEAVKNNVFGTRVVADLAHKLEVRHFVMISTDKAVNPTSVMGATKRAAEIYLQALSQRSSTRFVAVRFGNVLGSAGSVIPIFKEQIARGGPVTVTHPEMKRYFMTIPEACQLVLQAGAMGEGGEIFILDMGDPMKIVDLAQDLIRLSGFEPGEDIEVEFTGLRPGEKLFEELSVADEKAKKTKHPKVFIGRIRTHDLDRVVAAQARLQAVLDGADATAVRRALNRMVPEYSPRTAVEPSSDAA